METELKAENMKIMIDGEPVALAPGDHADFKSLLEHLAKEHVPSGRVITAMRLNEEFLTEEQEIAFGATPVSDIELLELETSSTDELAVETLMDYQDYLPKLSEQFERCAKEFRGGDQRKAFALFGGSVEFIAAFIDILDHIRKVFFIDFSKIECGDKTLMDLNLRMHSLSQEILESSEKADWALLADLLDFELSPLLYEWMAEIPELIKAIEDRKS
jgi:hypothetical protein